jgi:cytochrome d ubiquinol oxidase subunit I
MVLSTLLAYLAIYIALLLAYIWAVFYLARQADEKSAAHSSLPTRDGAKTPLEA